MKKKFLGIILDQYLRWDKHAEYLQKKLAIFCIKSIRKMTSLKTATIAYHSMFHSIISYGILMWGNSTRAHDIFILQKKALRAIHNLPNDASCKTLFRKTNIMTLPGIYIYELLKYVKQNESKFKLSKNVHEWNTRQKDKIRPQLRALKVSQRDITYIGAVVYNKLQKEIRDLPVKDFKIKVKTMLINCEFYSIKDFMEYGLTVPW